MAGRWVAAFLALVSSAVGEAADTPAFLAPLMQRAPVIDGRIDTGEWALSAGFDGLRWKGELQQRRARAYVGATADSIFVAVASRLPDEGELRATVERDTLKAVYDDSVEVYIDPTPGSGRRVIYQFLVNSRARGGYTVHTFGGAEEEAAWRGGWEQAHGFHDSWWHFECRVPVASMTAAKGRKTTEGTWGINLTRNWKNPWQWSSLSGGYQDPIYRFRFTAEPGPAVAYECSSDPFLAGFTGTLRLRNPSHEPFAVKASLVLTRNRMPALRREEVVGLAAGGAAELVLRCPEDDATTRFELAASVTSPDGTVIYYRRTTAWPRGKPYRWVARRKKPAQPVDFRFAYYPYRDRMRIVADISALPKEARPARVVASVRPKEGRRPVATVGFPVDGFRDGRQERTVELPPLEGEYEVALRVEGENVPAGEVAKAFERRRFAWERNSLGTSAEVHPPFTPIRVRRNRLGTVLREHALNGLGLWDQVEATSAHTGVTKPVLASPMRYIVRIDGKAMDVTPRRLRYALRKPHRLEAEGGFAAGKLNASCNTAWDYDGTVRVELTLDPTGGSRVDDLTLEIPFRKDAATHIHANADRIRAPVAQRIPGGEGIVWDASKVACDDYIRNFCPYVYLGTPVRGICWFAENDLGWSWDGETPNLDVVREGEAVVLRVHLVNKPVVIREPRTITFGLLAAPVKPRLAPGGRNWWRYRYYRDKYTLLGTDINWLSRGTCGSVYPVGKDMYFWEMIARGNGEKLDAATIAQVVERGRKYFEPYGEKKVKSWEAHVGHNLRSRYGKKMAFYYNRASYQAADEFQTFEDEWSLNDLRSYGKGNGIGEIKIVPSRSYIDHALYWYARSFEAGANRGVYWDNFFIAPSFNTEMTDAYRRDDGSIAPAAGIWALRELCRRTFVMMNEKGMLPITFPHMTSFNPLPMMAFATVQYDWEWKYSTGDVQDRHSRELILLTSTGELAGVWPVPLGDHGRLERDEWTQRTFTGVRLVHELDGYGGFGLGYVKCHAPNRRLAEPILGLLDEPGLQVYRYWDERPQPVRASSPDVHTIVYSLPGNCAVAAVVSYSARDEDVEIAVDLGSLGIAPGYSITDVETGEAFSMRTGRLRFPLRRHDIKVLHIASGEM